MDAKHRVDKLLEQKRKIDKQIDDIQSKCNHSNKVIKQVQETGFNPRWTCEDCNRLLGYPTDFELKKVNFFGKKQ
tara:strand:+ start:1018 stop:1242 length:225 start_codon:yes stop_codon:yes gene_type:complete